jgi:hypothetical protein
MERETKTITWVIACESPETLRRAEQFVKREIDPNRTFIDVAIAFPNGVEQRLTAHHRLGDYFERLQVVANGVPHHPSFNLVFQPRLGAKHYWKDLMVQVLSSLHQDFPGVSIEPANR